MYLLDTPVIAELRRAKSGRADEHVTRWASNVPAQNLFISVMSLLELEGGIAEVQRKDKILGAALRSWIEETVPAAFEGRILSVDLAVTKRRAALPFSDGKDRDALLAATALTHGLTLVTRSLSAYRFSKVKLFNPWGYTPEDEDAEADWQDVSRSGPLWLKNLFLRF
jgi:toxin FitB